MQPVPNVHLLNLICTPRNSPTWWLQCLVATSHLLKTKLNQPSNASVGSLLAWVGQHNVSSARLGSVACRKLCQKATEARGCSVQGCASRHLDADGDMKLVGVKNRKVIGAPASNREGKLKHLGSHQPVIQRSSMADFPDSPQMLVKFPESYVFCWSNSNVSRSNSGLFFGKSPRCFLKSHLILG